MLNLKSCGTKYPVNLGNPEKTEFTNNVDIGGRRSAGQRQRKYSQQKKGYI